MLIAAIDIGTSSTRALLFDHARYTGQSAAVEYALKTPEPGAAELDAIAVMNAVVECVQRLSQLTSQAIDCVALSSAMHSLLAVDARGVPLTPVYTWADNRASCILENFEEWLPPTVSRQSIYLETGVPIHPMSPLLKLVWLKAAQRAVFEATDKFVSIKEFVCHQLFGRWVVDDSIASASGLYSLTKRDWCEGALIAAGITRAQLSELAAPTTLLRGLSAGYAVAMNLPTSTPFALGGSDGCLANLGAGVLSGSGDKRAVLTIGTSGALRMAVPAPATDAAMRTFCYALSPADNEYVIGGATNGGGLPMRWLRDNFPLSVPLSFVPSQSVPFARPQLAASLRADLGAADPYSALACLAEQAPPGANGLLFHPYLAGERAPLWNADARASFIGLTFSHGPAHLVRAVMEGVLFNLSMILDVLEELAGGQVDEIVAGGGFARSDFWLQMAADLFNRPLVVADNPESTAQGAALLALQAMGSATTLAAAAASLPPATRRITPEPNNAAIYAKLKPIFTAVPATLAPFYSRLAAFQRGR
jgi:gluconokinase